MVLFCSKKQREFLMLAIHRICIIRMCSIIAVCIYRLVMISIEWSETAQKVHWKSETNSV